MAVMARRVAATGSGYIGTAAWVCGAAHTSEDQAA